MSAELIREAGWNPDEDEEIRRALIDADIDRELATTNGHAPSSAPACPCARLKRCAR